MKNLFKNLMLVAVAAMAFTSCSQDVNELNKLEKKTTFEFVASFDGDTRSGFTGSSEDENGKVVYHSEWFGGETVMLVAGDQVKSATVDAEGKFTATFDGEISQIDIYTPMESFYKPYMDYNFYQVNPEVLAEQTPLANSVDPKAHVAKGYVLVDGEGNQIIPVTLAHEVAYGKMTVNTPAEFVIDHVEIALNGVFDGSTRNLSYTINADKVENNVFWFATEPITVSDFTVTAYDAEGKAVAKTVDVAEAGKTMSFQYGRVGTFSVSELKEYEAPAAPMFECIGINGTSNDIVLKLYNEVLGELWINFYGNSCPLITTEPIINIGQYRVGYGLYFGGNYGQYKPANMSWFVTGTPNYMTVDVSVVNGMYKIVVNADYTNQADGAILTDATFIGHIPGLDVPDSRQALPSPVPTGEVTGNLTATISWPAVDGAVEYSVSCNCGIDMTTTETSVDLTFPEYGVHYVYVKAIAATDDADYKNSVAAYTVITMDDPRVKIATPYVNIAVDGKNLTFTWDACEGAVAYHVYNYNNTSMSITTAETSALFEMDKYATEYTFCIQALAEEGTLAYKNSDIYWFYPKTGYDPNMVPINFTSCELNEYLPGQWRVSYNFSDDNGNSMTLWLTTDHGATDTSFGSTNKYDQFYSSPGSVGNYYRFSLVNVVVNGVNKYVKGGNVNIENLGTSWNINMDITFDDDSMQLFTYSGGIGTTGGDSGDSGDSGEFTPDYTITNFSYYRLSTSYYTYQWSVQTSNGLNFSIYTPYNQGAQLHEGTYNYYSGSGNTNGDFTFSTRTFSPAPGSGTMVVSKDGDTYTINLTVVVGGTTQKYQYVGTL